MPDNCVYVKKYNADERLLLVDKKEVWRYAGYAGCNLPDDDTLSKLLDEVIEEFKSSLSYNVCYYRAKIDWEMGMPVLPFESDSKDLAKCLEGSHEVVIFAATIGLAIDRAIAKYRLTSPTKALIIQAFGAERVERLCDIFCDEIKNEVASKGNDCTWRFSPGYGDLQLDVQRSIFRILDPEKRIGISLGESLLMTPSKSVTAIFGLKEGGTSSEAKCNLKCGLCTKTDCEFRQA